MKTLKRIVEILEGIHYQLQLANWQRSGGKPRYRPVDPHADPNVRYFNGQPMKTLADREIKFGETSVTLNGIHPMGEAIVDGIKNSLIENSMRYRGRSA